MKPPEIGDIITTKEALKLCRYFGLDYLVERIESDPERYKLGSSTDTQAYRMKEWELLFSCKFTQMDAGKFKYKKITEMEFL